MRDGFLHEVAVGVSIDGVFGWPSEIRGALCGFACGCDVDSAGQHLDFGQREDAVVAGDLHANKAGGGRCVVLRNPLRLQLGNHKVSTAMTGTLAR